MLHICLRYRITVIMLKYLCLCLAIAVVYSQQGDIDCPEACTCIKRQMRCRRSRQRGRCFVLIADCNSKYLTSVPDAVPSSSKAVLLSDNNILDVNLDIFQNFVELTVLTFAYNGAERFEISQKIKNLERLSLAHNQISSLPPRSLSRFLKRLTHLNLNNNMITNIHRVRFPRKLQILNLNNNQITALSSKSFMGLQRLQVLKLNHNQINSIHFKAFKHLNLLENLELEDNRLSELVKEVFSSLSYGWYINLRNNSINEMHQTSFQSFGSRNENHCEIHLENNEMSFVERATIAEQILDPNHYTIFIAGNPIFCDCNLINLRNETGTLLGDTKNAVCDSPNPYVGVNIKDLHIDECCF